MRNDVTPGKVRLPEDLGLERADFIPRTNSDYADWCSTFYQNYELDDRGMASLHGLWAWQEQERRLCLAADELAQMRKLLSEWLDLGYSNARDARTAAACGREPSRIFPNL